MIDKLYIGCYFYIEEYCARAKLTEHKRCIATKYSPAPCDSTPSREIALACGLSWRTSGMYSTAVGDKAWIGKALFS